MSDALDFALEAARLAAELERHGFRRCDVAACNCGRWHKASDTPAESHLWATARAVALEDAATLVEDMFSDPSWRESFALLGPRCVAGLPGLIRSLKGRTP